MRVKMRPVNRPLIALTSDFGLEDPYVGIMKGVILGIRPDVCLIDLTHGVPPQDVVAGTLALESARPYFPENSIHVAVVDPGVGGSRDAVVVFTDRDVFVAPDNGLLSFLSEGEIREIRAIRNASLLRHPVSRTFHGRDVFAPVAAHLARGIAPGDIGPPRSEIVRLPLPRAVVTREEVNGEILTFDRFGNAITSIRGTEVPEGFSAVRAGGVQWPVASTYEDVSRGEPLALVGSFGRIELSVRNGNARESLGLCSGIAVSIRAD